MKVIAFNGSPHKMGNTASALELAKEQFESAGIEFEIFHVGTKPVAGCMGCGMCFKNKNEECIIKGDSVNEAIQSLISPFFAVPYDFSFTIDPLLDQFFSG